MVVSDLRVPPRYPVAIISNPARVDCPLPNTLHDHVTKLITFDPTSRSIDVRRAMVRRFDHQCNNLKSFFFELIKVTLQASSLRFARPSPFRCDNQYNSFFAVLVKTLHLAVVVHKREVRQHSPLIDATSRYYAVAVGAIH